MIIHERPLVTVHGPLITVHGLSAIEFQNNFRNNFVIFFTFNLGNCQKGILNGV